MGVVSKLVEDEGSEVMDDSWTLEKVQSQVDLGACELDECQKREIHGMLMEVSKVLSKGDDDIGDAHVTPHQIVLSNETPIWQRPRNFAQPVNEEIENECKELLASNIIEFSDSRWSSPCVPVRKADGKLRLCIDYRKLNFVTLTEQFPMPNLNHCLYKAHNNSRDKLQGAVFTPQRSTGGFEQKHIRHIKS